MRPLALVVFSQLLPPCLPCNAVPPQCSPLCSIRMLPALPTIPWIRSRTRVALPGPRGRLAVVTSGLGLLCRCFLACLLLSLPCILLSLLCLPHQKRDLTHVAPRPCGLSAVATGRLVICLALLCPCFLLPLPAVQPPGRSDLLAAPFPRPCLLLLYAYAGMICFSSSVRFAVSLAPLLFSSSALPSLPVQ